jgi:hypothetical protein
VVESGDLDVFKEIAGSSATLLAMKLSEASAEELSAEVPGEFDSGLQSELPPEGLPVGEGGLPQLDGVEPDARPHADAELGPQAGAKIPDYYPDASQKGIIDPSSPLLLKYSQTQALLAQLPDFEPMAKADDDSRLGTAVNSIVAALTDSVQNNGDLFDSAPDSPNDSVPEASLPPGAGPAVPEGVLDLTIDHFLASQLTDGPGAPEAGGPDAGAPEGQAPEAWAPEETGTEKPAPVEATQPVPSDTFFCEPVEFDPVPEPAKAAASPSAPAPATLDESSLDDDIIDGEPLGDNPEATAEALYSPAIPLDQAPDPETGPGVQEPQSPPEPLADQSPPEPEPMAADSLADQSPPEPWAADSPADQSPVDESLAFEDPADGENLNAEAPATEAGQVDETPIGQELPGAGGLTIDGYLLDPNAPDELDDETPAIFEPPREGQSHLAYRAEPYAPAVAAPLAETDQGPQGDEPAQGQGLAGPLEADGPTEDQEFEGPAATGEASQAHELAAAGEPGQAGELAVAGPASEAGETDEAADLGVFGELSRDEDSGPDPEATDEHLAALDDPDYDPVNDPAGTRARTEPLTYIHELGASAGSHLASAQTPAAEPPLAEGPELDPEGQAEGWPASESVGDPVGEPEGAPMSELASAEGGDEFDTDGLDFSAELEPSLEPQIATNIPDALPPMILYSPPRPVPKIISPEASTAVIVNYLEDTDDNMLASQGKVDELAEEEDMDIDLMDMHSQEPVRLEAKPMVPVPKSPV